jgi:hypothetical protein
MQHRITVDPDTAAKARRAIERMVAVGGRPTPLSLDPSTAEDPGE